MYWYVRVFKKVVVLDNFASLVLLALFIVAAISNFEALSLLLGER